MPSTGAWRRILLLLAAAAAVWATVVALTGGFSFRSDIIRISSHNPMDAALVAIFLLAAVATIDWTAGARAKSSRLTTILMAHGVALVAWQWMAGRPLWVDEEMIALNIRDRSIFDFAGSLWLDQVAPLGWLAAERAALIAFGAGEVSMRLVAALFGAATVMCAAWIGHRWMSPAGACVFVLLCSFGQWMSFYAVELKHYSADTFFGLLVPALAAVAASRQTMQSQRMSIIVWFVIAAAGLWLSFGGIFVLPACAAVVAGALLQQKRRATLPLFALGCSIIAASFAAHYALALRHAHTSEFLRDFWAFAFPPEGAGPAETLKWFRDRLAPFAMKPGGSALWISFWVMPAAGLALSYRQPIAIVGALILASAFALTLSGVVPLYERLSLWFVPWLYFGSALFADAAVRLARTRTPSRWLTLPVAAGIALAAYQFCGDVVRRGIEDVRTMRPTDSNRATDDRSAVRWLMTHHEPGSVLLTHHLALPAVWWYGGGDMRNPGTLGDTPLFELEPDPDDSCPAPLGEALKGRTKCLLYFGFEDYPQWFDDAVLRQLEKFGSVTALRHFGTVSRAAVVDLRLPAQILERWKDGDSAILPSGCITAEPAARW